MTDPVSWRGHTPFSNRYEDVYYDETNGLNESRYVFLEGNNLPDSGQNSNHFTIIETGFGTGLNFLTCWDEWQKKAHGHLHYVSIEANPLSPAQLEKALTPFEELGDKRRHMIQTIGLAQSGFHRFHLTGKIHLTLCIGLADDMLEQLDAAADAWFLDGFAPSRNPDMWSDRLFKQMARLSHGATSFATFTAASAVRKGLEAAGFAVSKRKGFGNKREMLHGTYQKAPARPARKYPEKVMIIGGGLAGTSCAAALQRYGINTQIIERNAALAQCASGNPKGILSPWLDVNDSPAGQYHLAAYRYGLRDITDVPHDICGQIRLDIDEKTHARHQKIADAARLPDDMMQHIDARTASQIAGISLNYGGLHLSNAATLHPPDYCRQMAQGTDQLFHHEPVFIEHKNGVWEAISKTGQTIDRASHLIISSAFDALSLTQTATLPMIRVRGQLSACPATKHSRSLQCAINYGGFIMPAYDETHILGATFQRLKPGEEADLNLTDDDHLSNFDQLQRYIPDLLTLPDISSLTGRSGVRCAAPDHLPIIGPVTDSTNSTFTPMPGFRKPRIATHDGLYIHTALGARGLSTAALNGELLACQILGLPLPIEKRLQDALAPSRFALREARKL